MSDKMSGKPRFKFLTGDVNYTDYGGKWISQRFNNGEFDFYFVLELINWENSVGEREAAEIGNKYNLSLSVVAPEQFIEKEHAMKSYGYEKATWDQLQPEAQVEVIHGYAGGAQIWNKNGNNFNQLRKEALQEVQTSMLLFGFAMDKAQNKIGSTGWDILKGDVMAGLRRYEESKAGNDPEKDLMLKIQKGNNE